MFKLVFFLTLTFFCNIVLSYNNGQGLKPALGWNSWCSIGHCGNDVCNENEVKQIANAMLSNGMFDAGYRHINLDDCWAGELRTSQGDIQPDYHRFPDGIKSLTTWLHDRGFTFGLYTSAGDSTCNPGDRIRTPPGSYGHYTQDANTFASWNVDYVKLDWCGGNLYNSTEQHTQFSIALNNTGRSMWLELCRGYGYPPPPYVAQVSQSWRIYGDHHDNWQSTYNAIEASSGATQLSGKYNWAYNDFLMTGGESCIAVNPNKIHRKCPGQSDIEYMTEFALWSIIASPLIVATDDIMSQILLNTEILAVNQENTTPAGDRISSTDCDKDVSNACQIWTRKLSDGSIATVLYNSGSYSHNITVDFTKLNMGWNSKTNVNIRDLWKHQNLGQFNSTYTTIVQSHGNSFLKLTQA